MLTCHRTGEQWPANESEDVTQGATVGQPHILMTEEELYRLDPDIWVNEEEQQPLGDALAVPATGDLLRFQVLGDSLTVPEFGGVQIHERQEFIYRVESYCPCLNMYRLRWPD